MALKLIIMAFKLKLLLGINVMFTFHRPVLDDKAACGYTQLQDCLDD